MCPKWRHLAENRGRFPAVRVPPAGHRSGKPLPHRPKTSISAATDKFSYANVGEWAPRDPLFYYLMAGPHPAAGHPH
jgi:hypothetical protein